MHYKTQQAITISVLLLFMLSIGFMINNLDGSITGAVVAEDCECKADSGCIDNDACTEDICLYPDNCEASLCLHKPIENCNE